MTTLALTLLLLAAEVAAPSPPAPPAVALTVSVGASHWVGQTFGAPIGMSTPAISIGVNPGLKWLELGLRYSIALSPLPLPGGAQSRVGFISLEVLLTREMRVAEQRFVLGAGPAGTLIHSHLGAGFGVGPVLFARYLIDLGPRLSLGPFFAMRPVFYHLPGDAQLLGRQDIQGDLGVVASF